MYVTGDPFKNRKARKAVLSSWHRRPGSLRNCHQAVLYIKASQVRIDDFRHMCAATRPKESEAARQHNLAVEEFLAHEEEVSAIDATGSAGGDTAHRMPPPRHPWDPTTEQIGDRIDNALNLMLAQETRWNSAEAEFTRFLKLRSVVELFLATHRTKGLSGVPDIGQEDWKVLETFVNVLMPFLYHTKASEGNDVKIHTVLGSLWSLEAHLREYQTRFGGEETTIDDVVRAR